MTGPDFGVTGIEVARYAAAPTLTARLRVAESGPDVVHAMAIRCQVRIEPQRRRYTDEQAGGLGDVFDERRRWSDTLRPFLWTNVAAVVPGFTGHTDVELSLPLTYDMEVAAGKYFHAVRDGEIPLAFMFSGTVFYRGDDPDRGFRVLQIPWNTDVEFRMPARVWQQAMDVFYPGAGWIMLPRETIDALVRFRSELGLPGWADTIDTLLDKAEVRPT